MLCTTPFRTSQSIQRALSLTFNGYSAPAGVNGALTFVAITRTSDNSLAFSTVGNNNLNSASLLANTLLPGTNYDLTHHLQRAHRFGSQTGFVPAADSFVAYDLRTDLLVTHHSRCIGGA